MKGSRVVFSWLLISIFIPCHAQEIPGPDSVLLKTIPGVVVTANRHNTLLLHSPETIRVIDRESMLNLRFRTAPEALMGSAGAFLQKTNHGGGSPILRGLTGNQTLLLIDGIRMSNSTSRYGPNQYFNTIDLFNLEKIEYLSGSGSVQYGSDAMGGVIHAFTQDPEFSNKAAWGAGILSRAGTHGMEKSLRGSIQFGNKKVALQAGTSWRSFGDLVGGDQTGRQTPSSYKEFDIDFKGRIQLSSTSRLTLAYQRVYQEDVWVYHKVVLENYAINKMDPQKRGLFYSRLHQHIGKGVMESMVLTVSMQESEEGRSLRKSGSDILRTDNDQVRTYAATAEWITTFQRFWKANTGIECYHDGVSSNRSDENLVTKEVLQKRGLYPDGSQMTSLSAYSLHTFDTGKWRATANMRFNQFIIKVPDGMSGLIRLQPSAWVGSLGLMRKLDESSGLFISLNSGFRAPNIDDLGSLGIVDFRYETPNFDLRPEQSLQYQAGYKYHGTRMKGEIFFYRNELFDLIVRNRVEGDSLEGYPVFIKSNTERAYIQGFETSLEFALNDAWHISGNAAYTFGHNISRDEPMRRIPPLFGQLTLEYVCSRFRLNLEWQAAGKQDRLASGDLDDNRIPFGGTPGWNIFNIRVGTAFRFLQADLSLLNLLNRDYRYHGSGVNATGRSAFLTLNIQV